MAPPIRVAFIGLSDHSWAAHSHFPALAASPDFEIIGLCNSSIARSQAAIEAFRLPESIKCYASPEEVANDADVDLVVCSTRVDRHLPTIGPSLKAGKNVYVEWPLGKDTAEARELARLKNEGGVKIATVGLQARQAPIIKKLKELVDGGRIGKVLSSTYTAQGSQVGEGVIEGSEYLGFTESGGNLITIRFGHQIDFVQQVLGYGFSSQHAVLANRRPEVGRRDQSGKLISEFTKTADDIINLVGTLKNGIPFSFSLNGAGKSFKGVPGLEWRIYGEKGELRVTAASPFLSACDDEMKIELYDFAADTVESVGIPKDEVDASSFHWATRNVARVYQALAKGEVNCSFEDAVERHEFLAELFRENGYFEY